MESHSVFVKPRKYCDKLCCNKYVNSTSKLNELNISEIIWKIFQSEP